MNNKNIELIRAEGYPYFPELQGINRTRVMTKHFTNLSLYLERDKLSFIHFLVYQSSQDNTIIYSSHLLAKYREAVLKAQEMYGKGVSLLVSEKTLRRLFSQLITEGYLLVNYKKFEFTLNPMLSYRAEYIRAGEYKELCKSYSAIQFGTGIDVREFCKGYRELINNRIRDKKK